MGVVQHYSLKFIPFYYCIDDFIFLLHLYGFFFFFFFFFVLFAFKYYFCFTLYFSGSIVDVHKVQSLLVDLSLHCCDGHSLSCIVEGRENNPLPVCGGHAPWESEGVKHTYLSLL